MEQKEKEQKKKKGLKYVLCRVSLVGVLTAFTGVSIHQIYNMNHANSIEKEADDHNHDDEMNENSDTQLGENSLESGEEIGAEDVLNTEFGTDFNTECIASLKKIGKIISKKTNQNEDEFIEKFAVGETSDKIAKEISPFHLHFFKYFGTSYQYDKDGTHIEITEKRCSCGKVKISKKTKSCQYGDWFSKGSLGEGRVCPDCKHEEKRDHSIDKKIKYIDNKNGTHNEKITDSCTTCDYINAIINDNVACNYGPWISANDKEEKRSCKDCSHVETRRHKITQKSEFISNKNGTHTEKITESCVNCDYTNIITKDDLTCNYGPWVSNGEAGDKRECNNCYYVDTKSHNFGPEIPTGKYEYAGDNKHTTKTKQTCGTCGDEKENKKPAEACNYGPWVSNGDAGEKRECGNCYHIDERSHTLGVEVSTGTYEYVGDNKHVTSAKQSCTTCDYEKTNKKPAEACNYGPWVSNGDAGEKRECGNCYHIDERSHILGTATPTGNYQFSENGKHQIEMKQTCSCGYEKKYYQVENCDLSGPRVTGNDGITVSVNCPKCHHDSVVHTHDLSNPDYEKADDACCKATISCTDPTCDYSFTSILPHDYKPTDEVNEYEDEDKARLYSCSHCGATKWGPLYYSISSISSNQLIDILMDDIASEKKGKTLVKKRNHTCC